MNPFSGNEESMRKLLTLSLLPLAALLGACEGGGTPSLTDGGGDDGDGVIVGDGDGDGDGDGGTAGNGPGVDPALAARQVDYNEALRTASIKLSRRLPTMEQIGRVRDATNPKLAYETELDAILDSPAFASRMVKFWRDTMRMGGDDLESAPVFAAQLMAEGRPFTELFTASSGNCPTYDGTTGTFTAGECNNGAPVQAGVLTHPGMMRQFYGNMAFRRVRWVQETFTCGKFPAEVSATPVLKDGKDFTSPWAFESISGTPINFLDTQSVVCANCHTTMNHIAPLFANFDGDGAYQGNIAVMTPLAPDPVATELSHWLPPGETPAWRFGQEVNDLAGLGQVLAEDPVVAECVVARVWNFAMSKEDIVTDLATVPFGVIEPFVTEFDGNGQDLKTVLRSMFMSEDFVSF